MQDPVRQRILARIGIQGWQLRRPQLLAGQESEAASEASLTQAPPAGKLWVRAQALPAPALLDDVCRLLGIAPHEVSLLPGIPEQATPPLLWLTEPDPDWPQALVCSLSPDAAGKRALWQQLRQRLPAHQAPASL
ncbi:DNA polymerase III subunit psi [Aeromonas bivalvium]|uniref:DNA polymerase III subunit psi n=1 Tax=Aeromonas bivalvium TaxID=440079 RepID=UPI0038D0CC36